MPKVCLVTSVQISANPRIVKEATALHEAGYDVHVIATEGSQSRQFDEAILSLAQWKYIQSCREALYSPTHGGL